MEEVGSEDFDEGYGRHNVVGTIKSLKGRVYVFLLPWLSGT